MIPERLADKIDASGDCWEWTGARTKHGYGRVSIAGNVRQAHRVVWELLVGLIHDGFTLDHLCRNERCVNPDHLEPVTHGENVLRGYSPTSLNARKTHCKNGHPFTQDNTYYEGHWRRCRTCNRAKVARFAQRQKATA